MRDRLNYLMGKWDRHVRECLRCHDFDQLPRVDDLAPCKHGQGIVAALKHLFDLGGR